MTYHQNSENGRLAAELEGTACPACHGFKKPGNTFCGRCYHRLPQPLRSKLYRRLGEGYAEAREEAMEYLEAN